MSTLVTRGLGESGGTGSGAATKTYTVDFSLILKPVATYSADLVVGAALPAAQNTATYSNDFVVGDSPATHYFADLLVIDNNPSDEAWGEGSI